MLSQQTESFFSFLDECVMQLLCSRTCSPSHALVGPNRNARLRLHAPPRLASPSRRERGECSAAEGHRRRRLRVRRRPAPPEPTGPRHRGRLAGDRPKKRNCAFTCSPGATHLAIWTSSMRSPLLCRSRRGATVPSALSVDNDSARPWTTYHCTHLLLSAALHDLTPHLLSIASSGSPECRMRCAIAHF